MRREQSEWWSRGFTKDWFFSLSDEERSEFLDSLDDEQCEEYYRDWRVWARDSQLVPTGNEPGNEWNELLAVCGRGWGKTRFAVELLTDEVRNTPFPLRIAIVGQGQDDIRRVMVEGESGFLNCAPSNFRPDWSPSVGGGTLTWPDGSMAQVYSAEDTEALRGPQFHWGWFDEPMAVPADKRERAYSNLRFCVRLGARPRRIITTTPKKHPWMKQKLIDANDPAKRILVVRGSTNENTALAQAFLEDIYGEYDGTRLGRQELGGELLGDEEGALWTTDQLDRLRMKDVAPEDIFPTCTKIVVGVDPNLSEESEIAHAAGIVVVGRRGDKRFVLADRTVLNGPSKWAEAAVKAAIEFDANEIVAEKNQGGDMVSAMIYQAADKLGVSVKVILVFSRKSKVRRAEPVSGLYDRNLVHHVGPAKNFQKLEDQMCGIHEDADETGEDFDRADALVCGLTRLGVKKPSKSSGATASGGFATFSSFSGVPSSVEVQEHAALSYLGADIGLDGI